MIVMLAILVMLVMMMMEDDDGDDDNEVMLGRASVLGGIRMWPSQEKRDKNGQTLWWQHWFDEGNTAEDGDEDLMVEVLW